MALLNSISAPSDLRALNQGELRALADEVRSFLIESICRSGGHLGPNLGVVELTIALHRVFDSPRVPIVFDTGHQSYVHKILTGRRTGMAFMRSKGGISGYPNRSESVHDVVENSHASTALSYVDGLSRAMELIGRAGDPVVAVVGDGALTGGLAWEALNNLGRSGRRVIVVLNDNGRSYAPTAGALPQHLRRLADRHGYQALADMLGGDRRAACVTGRGAHPSVQEQAGLFSALGFGYLGPVEGHDIAALEEHLRLAAATSGPVLVHCLTRKGNGYSPAESDPIDRMHSVGAMDPVLGRAAVIPRPTWTDAFADALLRIGDRREDVVAISAAMLGPTGLAGFAERYPDRCFDVGIAEAHAVTLAAGLAMGGLHPVVALYATFAGRAFDQVLLDVALHRLPVTLVLDRAGITGPDGPSHHGMWDLALMGIVPGLRMAAPRDPDSLIEELGEAVETATGPTVLRFPKEQLGAAVPAVDRIGGVDLLRTGPGAQVLIIAVGALCQAALSAAEELAAQGIDCTVADLRWVLPVPRVLPDLVAGHRMVVTVEDGLRTGGVGSRVAALLADRHIDVPVRCLGLPQEFIAHGSRAELLADAGLDPGGIAAAVREFADTWCGQRRKLALLTGGHLEQRQPAEPEPWADQL